MSRRRRPEWPSGGHLIRVRNPEPRKRAHFQLSKAPTGTAALGVIFSHGPWKVSASDKYVGDTWFANDHTNPLNLAPGYHSTDISVTYNFPHWRLQASVYNLFDSQHVVSISAPQYYFQPARNFQISAKASF